MVEMGGWGGWGGLMTCVVDGSGNGWGGWGGVC